MSKKFKIVGGVIVAYTIINVVYCYRIGALKRMGEMMKYSWENPDEQQCSIAEFLNYAFNGGERPTAK
jgi:hypothetical protein